MIVFHANAFVLSQHSQQGAFLAQDLRVRAESLILTVVVVVLLVHLLDAAQTAAASCSARHTEAAASSHL